MSPSLKRASAPALLMGLALGTACTPTVRVMAPTEPIEINLNINITQDIRVRMDREIEGLITDNPDLF